MTRSTPARLFACGRQVRQITLRVHLGFLAFGRRGERDHPEHAWTHALRDCLDRATLAGAVTSLEHDADPETLVDDPPLQFHELDVEILELTVVVFGRQVFARRPLGRAVIAILTVAVRCILGFGVLLSHGHLHQVVISSRSAVIATTSTRPLTAATGTAWREDQVHRQRPARR